MKHFIKYVYIYVFLIVVSISVGFSAMNRNLMMRDLGAQIRIIKDIRITNITPNGSTSDGLAISEDYNVNNITPNFSLPNSDSTVTYTVEVTNIGNQNMGIAEITGCPSNLVCEVSNYQMTEPLCDDNNSSKCSLGAVKTFNITMKYADGAYDANNTTFDLLLEFDFRGYHTITYVNAPRGNNYKTYAMNHMEFIQSGVPIGGASITFTNTDNYTVAGSQYNIKERYVKIDSVESDVTIKFWPLSRYIDDGLYSGIYANPVINTVKNGNYTYNRATSLGIINDRFGGRANSANGGDLRYYGTNPSNYIYFNCQDYDNQSDSTCEKWRIIGVFGGKVKLLRESPIGQYSWDTSTNNWKTSAANKLLNSGFETASVGGSLYWNAASGKCYSGDNAATSNCDFTTTGLQNDDTRNFITDETLYFTSPNLALVSISDMYYYEHGNGSIYSGNDTSWTGKVALMYPTDYYYSADLSNCNHQIYWMALYTSCANSSWIKSNNSTWTITPGQSGATNAWYIVNNSSANYSNVSSAFNIWPTLYLDPNTIIIEGNGSSSNPYQIYPLA